MGTFKKQGVSSFIEIFLKMVQTISFKICVIIVLVYMYIFLTIVTINLPKKKHFKMGIVKIACKYCRGVS